VTTLQGIGPGNFIDSKGRFYETEREYFDLLTKRFDRKSNLLHGFVSSNIYRAAEDKWFVNSTLIPNVLTNGGRDLMHAQFYVNTSAGTRGANYLAVSEDAGGASAAHTATASEITTNGLARAVVGTITHTGGTNSTVFDHTYTASGSFTAVQLVGTYNASSGPTLAHEGTITSAALISGDKLQIVYTLNGG
jgi:hypothetical protein